MKYKNNPFNIRRTSACWKGLLCTNKPFCEFVDIPHAVRVALYLILKTYVKRGITKLGDVISTWAPQSDGNDSELYIRYVCGSNFTPDTVVFSLQKYQIYLILYRICFMETNYSLSYSDFCAGWSLYEKF